MAGYITVLLQKSNPAGDWGFKMGSLEPAASVVITQIDQSCVAAELLEAGDRIIEIEGIETSKLRVDELQALLGNPSKRLSMVVLKKNLPKGNCSVRKSTTEEVATVEETREEIERKKEYEVVLEVSPRQSLDDVMKTIREKIERGEKLDAKELQITSSLNTNIQTSTVTMDSIKQRIERDYGMNKEIQKLGPTQKTEVMKRKEKFMREQKKEEIVRCEKMKQEQNVMEERKKKANAFWTEPPSDLKSAIKNSQYWKSSDTDENYSTSAIFSHLNDLHNTLRKGSARDEKRQFWENCRKKYGWDPPATKYNVSHRPTSQMDIRSRSCEPEHLDSQNPFKREDYRQTNPFYSPTPTNPFYLESCNKSASEDNLSSIQLVVPQRPSPSTKIQKSVEDLSMQSCKESTAKSGQECGEKMQQTNEAYREDFTNKCEFFERATSVPTTSCVKNAQDIVSERLAMASNTQLRKPSEFISDVQSESRRANLSTSSSERETVSEPAQDSSQVKEDINLSTEVSEINSESSRNIRSEHKAFLGQSVLRQSVSGSTNISSRINEQAGLALKKQQIVSENLRSPVVSDIAADSLAISEKTKTAEPVKSLTQQLSMENEIKNHPIVIAAQQKECVASQISESQTKLSQQTGATQFARTANEALKEQREALKSDSFLQKCNERINETAQQIEAQMQESINRIKAESEKLCSLDVSKGCRVITQGELLSNAGQMTKNELERSVIPDSTAFPGLTYSGVAEYQKRSFSESSYEKVTKTGSPFENVESAWKREYRMATPGGAKEEVFKEASRIEELREAAVGSGIEASFREVTQWDQPQPSFEYSCGYTRQSNEIQNNSATSNFSTGNGAPPPPPPPCAGNLPAVRIASEIGPKKTFEPPAAIQNAMMTKDKKPFTYTPGGLNLNEIRSPRMARRISKNAHIEDSCSPQIQAPTSPHGPLPPSVQAAIQPQIAVPVFPAGAPPPPPPLPGQGPPPASQVPPPPPQPTPGVAPANRPPQQQQEFNPPLARPEFLADIASHPPLRPVGQPPRSSFEPSGQVPLQVQLKAISPRPSPDPSVAHTEPQFQNTSPISEVPVIPQQVRSQMTPPTVQVQVKSAPPTPPPFQQQRAPPTPPVQAQTSRTPPTLPAQPPPQVIGWGNRTPPTPPNTMNKSPAPWMTSKTVQKESPPPWAVRTAADSPQITPPIIPSNSTQEEHMTRVIPIQIEGREPVGKSSPGTIPQYIQPSPTPQQYRYVQPPPNFPGQAPPTPPPYQQYQQGALPQWPQPQSQQHSQFQQTPPQQQEQTGRTRIIPIVVEGANKNQQSPSFQSQNSYPGNFPQKSQNGEAVDPRKFQTQTSYSGNPIQSRSFRVLQKITGSEDETQKRLDESEY